MLIWYFCFIVGAAAALLGMGMGIAMGITQDFTLAPVHAHLNLLGWVSMMLYGLYYRGLARPVARAAWMQVTTATIGFVAMTVGLWLHVPGHVSEAAESVLVAGALLAIGSMILFMIILIHNLADLRSELPGS